MQNFLLQCAKRCVQSKSFDCRAFSYSGPSQTCYFATDTVQSGSVVISDPTSDYYEIRTASEPAVVPNPNQSKIDCEILGDTEKNSEILKETPRYRKILRDIERYSEILKI